MFALTIAAVVMSLVLFGAFILWLIGLGLGSLRALWAEMARDTAVVNIAREKEHQSLIQERLKTKALAQQSLSEEEAYVKRVAAVQQLKKEYEEAV